MIVLAVGGAVAFALFACFVLTWLFSPEVRARGRSRRQAEENGLTLLRRWLTPKQAEQWDSRREFDVVGCDTHARYRIKYGKAMNVQELDSDGKPVTQWCFAPEGNLVVGDVLLAQKIALETLELKALATANRQPYRR